MLEKNFQSKLISEIKEKFPGCIVMKNDPNYIQGIPDLIVLKDNKWVALEVKKNKNSSHRPNQDYYISQMNEMSYASFISPENKEEVLNDISKAFES